MNEAKWLSSSNLMPMLDFLQTRGKASDRKLRLFACACTRRVWHLLKAVEYRRAVEVTELAVDDPGLQTERYAAADQALEVWSVRAAQRARRTIDGNPDSEEHAGEAATTTAGYQNVNATAAARSAASAVARKGEQKAQCELLRDIFGVLPWRAVRIEPAWLAWNDSTVRRLAEVIYEERSLPEGTLDNGRLAVLADALEDAGCNEPEILDHCRGPGPHTRGCWVVDLLLGKE